MSVCYQPQSRILLVKGGTVVADFKRILFNIEFQNQVCYIYYDLPDYFHSGENAMKLTPPKTITWWIAVILGVLGFLGTQMSIPVASANAFWFVFFGWLLLVIATLVKGL
jgi:hypothetical protein